MSAQRKRAPGRNAGRLRRAAALPGKGLHWLAEMARLIGWRLVHGAPDVAAASLELAGNPVLARILGARPLYFSRLVPMRPRLLVGWGHGGSGRRAQRLRSRAEALLLVEDGFLRSVERRDPPLSLLLDRGGMHYDPGSSSDLFRAIERPLDAAETARADRLIALWRQHGLSKFNGSRDPCGLPPPPYVLVVDQVAGDRSITAGGADAATFPAMLRAALSENPACRVVVKLHPDSAKDPARRHFDPEALGRLPGVEILAGDRHVARLIAGAEAVYTATSQVGFEALLWGRRVRCFGMPFYAGRGLTEDALPPPPGRKPASLHQLVHAALVDTPRYCHPETSALCTPEAVMDYLGLQRARRSAFPALLHAVGFPRRKHRTLRRFLQGSALVFVPDGGRVPPGATAVLWGNRSAEDLPPGTAILRVEDGFLRSVGLGAALVPPLSWVIDDLGIHYDSRRPSRLETILQETTPDAAALLRARSLRESLLARQVTKYNLPGRGWTRPSQAERVILVPGQVEADASIRFGSPEITTNIGLLARVRAENPRAFVVYKPHPDVVAGLRDPGEAEHDAASLCDAIVTGVSTTALLEEVDEVHTLTSLLGFEALLRGRPVTCHGQPFYAGWGLTTDRMPLARRTRRLDLDHLVHGALVAYPRYVSGITGRFSTPEQTVRELAAARRRHARRGAVVGWLAARLLRLRSAIRRRLRPR